jgi:hypothetical protein
MKTRKTILLGFVLLTASVLTAQVPGYMGKRLTLGYSNNFFAAIIGPPAQSYDMGINTTHSFNIEFTIKPRTNFCLSYQMFNTGVTTNHTFVNSTQDQYGNVYNVESHFDPVPNKPMELHSNNVCIGFKFFNAGSLAPVGKYRKLELVLMFTELSYPPNSFFTYNYNYGFGGNDGVSRSSLGTGNYNFKSFALTYSLGRQRVLFNRLVLDYGLQFGFVPAGVFATLNSEGDFSDASTPENVFRQETNKRLFRHQLFNFHIGLGFLAI